MLYDPYGSSEDGMITLEPDSVNFGIKQCEVEGLHVGLMLTQDNDTIVLDVNQMEQLYQILKHNR